MNSDASEIVVIGLGYVGLPLALAMAREYPVIGFDTNPQRVNELQSGVDCNGECELAAPLPKFLNQLSKQDLNPKVRHFFLITVPTPLNEFRQPDLSYLLEASRRVARLLSLGDVVVYESTVYPGCTEEDCVPVLEKESGLTFNTDFFCGYSPERINPGDKINTLGKIRKITSGSTPEAARLVDELYASVIPAGTYQAPSIRVAEAAKIIENCQRDVNISFMNELALIFDRLGIDTKEVIKAASTKWNFLPFQPGLVGGHCISVDPYYMIHKAESVGYHPDLIGAGRRINDSMASFVASKSVKLMIQKGLPVKGASALILGITFKENCSDIRNTRVADIRDELLEYGLHVDIADPRANPAQLQEELNIRLQETYDLNDYDLLILAVPHSEFLEGYKQLTPQKSRIIFDIRSAWPRELVDATL